MNDKKYCDGMMTEAQFNSFIMSCLRSKHWKPKSIALAKSECGKILNPSTGRLNKAYRCAYCGGKFIRKDVNIDHIDPVVPLYGDDNFNIRVFRMFCDSNMFQVLCKPCHKDKTKEENKTRKENKKNANKVE